LSGGAAGSAVISKIPCLNRRPVPPSQCTLLPGSCLTLDSTILHGCKCLHRSLSLRVANPKWQSCDHVTTARADCSVLPACKCPHGDSRLSLKSHTSPSYGSHVTTARADCSLLPTALILPCSWNRLQSVNQASALTRCTRLATIGGASHFAPGGVPLAA
jgi:hypothetical protein